LPHYRRLVDRGFRWTWDAIAVRDLAGASEAARWHFFLHASDLLTAFLEPGTPASLLVTSLAPEVEADTWRDIVDALAAHDHTFDDDLSVEIFIPAEEEALALGDLQVGSEHLVLGQLATDSAIGAVLRHQGIELEPARQWVRERRAAPRVPPLDEFDPRTRRPRLGSGSVAGAFGRYGTERRPGESRFGSHDPGSEVPWLPDRHADPSRVTDGRLLRTIVVRELAPEPAAVVGIDTIELRTKGLVIRWIDMPGRRVSGATLRDDRDTPYRLVRHVRADATTPTTHVWAARSGAHARMLEIEVLGFESSAELEGVPVPLIHGVTRMPRWQVPLAERD
jgi:hypothetical protein